MCKFGTTVTVFVCINRLLFIYTVMASSQILPDAKMPSGQMAVLSHQVVGLDSFLASVVGQCSLQMNIIMKLQEWPHTVSDIGTPYLLVFIYYYVDP